MKGFIAAILLTMSLAANADSVIFVEDMEGIVVGPNGPEDDRVSTPFFFLISTEVDFVISEGWDDGECVVTDTLSIVCQRGFNRDEYDKVGEHFVLHRRRHYSNGLTTFSIYYTKNWWFETLDE